MNLLQQLDSELEIIVSAARRSLVQVLDGRRGGGAGTIVHREGLIVTNAHVVRRRSPRVRLWDGRELQGRLLGYDEGIDLAAVAVEASDLPAVEMGNGLRAGQWVVALGHPWGVTGAASAGMVIAVGEPMEGPRLDGGLVQVGLKLRPGHSGGPMLDGDGRLVGINTMISGPGVGLAVPVWTVKRFLKDCLGSKETVRV